jgi:hypothetical protein
MGVGPEVSRGMLRMTMKLGIAAPLALLVLGASAAPAYAGDAAAAQTLFSEAKKLMAKGDYATACPKLEESERLDPGVGTQFNLADCYEKTGRTASAWSTFLDVAAATKGQPAREKVARDRAAALEPKLTRLNITAPSANKNLSLEVKRDGTVIGHAEWGTAIPVDPGPHVIGASAPGMKPWQTTLIAQGEAQTTSVAVPELQPEPAAAPAAAPADATPARPTEKTETSSGGGPGAAVFILGGIGVAGLAVGSAFGFLSMSKHGDASSHCNGDVCDATGVSLRDDAIHTGNISTVAFGVGAAAIVGAGVLWIASSSSKSSQTGLTAAPLVGANGGGVMMRGAW